jgi:transposase-like protein
MPPANRKNPVRAQSSESQYSLVEFMREYPDDETCLEHLWRNGHSPDGEHAYCSKCEQERELKRYETKQQRQSWTCVSCGNHIHPTAGTIFHKSSTSLHLWFYAIYLMSSTRCGISAKQVERELGVTYKTAWRMCEQIRNRLMKQDAIQMDGTIEADETYIGGKRRGDRPGRPGKTSNKVAVFGMAQRSGKVAIVKVDSVSARTLTGHIVERAIPASTIYTDEYRSYARLNKMGFNHSTIAHKERIYVSGDVHTNTIEGFWSLVKRGISGVYHNVSAKYLQGYLNEYAWRYNHRDDPQSLFSLLLVRAARGF